LRCLRIQGLGLFERAIAYNLAMPESAFEDSLSPKTRSVLRARAHSLKPVVWIAQRGLTEGALREVDRALDAHELIKIHAALGEREDRTRLLATLCRELKAEPVQIIGKMLIAYRLRPPEPAAAKPAPGKPRSTSAARSKSAAGKRAASAKRTQRRQPPRQKPRRAP
jgi:RNA-binding protein